MSCTFAMFLSMKHSLCPYGYVGNDEFFNQTGDIMNKIGFQMERTCTKYEEALLKASLYVNNNGTYIRYHASAQKKSDRNWAAVGLFLTLAVGIAFWVSVYLQFTN